MCLRLTKASVILQVGRAENPEIADNSTKIPEADEMFNWGLEKGPAPHSKFSSTSTNLAMVWISKKTLHCFFTGEESQ